MQDNGLPFRKTSKRLRKSRKTSSLKIGLCEALARNDLNNLCLGKEILGPVVFQGGVAANASMVRAFEEALNTPVTVPPHYDVMGAIGAALLAHEYMEINGDRLTRFKGWEVSEVEYDTSSFECKGCPV